MTHVYKSIFSNNEINNILNYEQVITAKKI